jgi:aminopeptidase N
MENFTVTTQTDLTLHDDRAALDGDSNGLVAHEAAHTWFGNVVTAKNWSHAWLHESFATYFDALYTRELKGEAEFRYQLLSDAETYFSEDHVYRRPIVTHVYKEPIDLFDAHLYPGGAVRLHHLKSIVGEEQFREALKIFLNRYQFGVVETVDFIRCLEEVTGRNFDEWLEQWIYRGGYPQLEVTFSWDSKHKLATVGVTQTQKAEKKGEELLFKLPFTVMFYYSRGEERFPITVKSDQEKFCFRLKGKPLFFRLDPDYECPCKKIEVDISRPMLHEQLKRDPDPIGRIEAAAALTKKTSASDVRVLSERLRKEKDWGVAVRIAKALGKIGSDAARSALINGLKTKDPKIRRGVVNALGNFPGDEKVARAIRRIAERDASYRVEAEALQALGKVKDKDSFAFLESSIGRPSHNALAQTAIYNALAELEDDASWDYLVRGAEYGAHRNSRQAAMRALAKLAYRYPHRKGEVIDHLKRYAREKRGTSAAVFRGKLGAISAMKQLEDLAVIPVLRQIVDNETDGRLQRRADETITYLRESAKKPKEMKDIRSELDDVVRENKSLRERIDMMEKKQEATTRKKKG